MGAAGTFLSLSTGEKLLAMEAMWETARARRAVKKLSYPALQAVLSQGNSENPSNPSDSKEAARIGRMVRIVSRRVPWQSLCLVQALAAKRMLVRRKLPAMIFVGVRHDEDKQLLSHAWLRCGETFVTGEKDHDQFQIITRYTQDSAQ